MEWWCARSLVVLLLCFLFIKLGCCDGLSLKPHCRDEEREALLRFKQDIRDPFNRLSSWAGEDCCKWEGVGCHNTTGHVLKLFLSYAGFSGVIPHQLGNLSKLHYLDIGDTGHSSSNSLYVEDLEWLTRLTSLKFLDMTGVNLSNASNWVQVMNKLPFLSVLHLSGCQLHTLDPLPHLNMTSLRELDLSYNNLAFPIPNWFYHMTTLEYLDLRSNHFHGKIRNDIENLTSITYLDLSYNALEGNDILRSLTNICAFQLANLSYHRSGKALKVLSLRKTGLKGPLPGTIFECKSLEALDLGMNHLSGQIPVRLGEISSLSHLHIDQNSFEGVISEKHLANLTRLVELDAFSNLRLTLNVSSNWTPPFQLRLLRLKSCLIGPEFPAWLQTQKHLERLEMIDAGISGAIPDWFWTAPYSWVDLSHNQITGNIPSLNFRNVYLSSNNFSGPLPQISSSVVDIGLAHNSFSGSLSSMLCQGARESNLLSALDVSGNFLSGEVPDCWMYWREMIKLQMGNNNLTGHLPRSMGSLNFLGSLHLRNNHLSGNFPVLLKNCINLQILDLSENEFTGSIPAWVGNFHGRSIEFIPGLESFPYTMGLKVLILSSNKLNGSIPHEICHLDSLQILELGNNNLSGTIPRCFVNFSRMSKPSNSSDAFSFRNDFFISWGLADVASLVMKGSEYEYTENLGLLAGIDLSSNKLCGEIPEDLTALQGLRFLNLSNNFLRGRIPDRIGAFTQLESLDLSMNSLSGVIPQDLATISFLSKLNLSYNSLSGKIPTGTQIQGFSELSFMGNPELCGPPLSQDHACPEDIKPKAPTPDKDEEEEEDGWIDMKWLYLGMPWGFAVGFWGILGPFALNKLWRH